MKIIVPTLLISQSTATVWHHLYTPIHKLWENKADYVSGILYHDYDINVETIPGLYDFIGSDRGCWCQSQDRNKIKGHKVSDEYDAICKQFHKCTECSVMKSCSFHKNEPLDISIRGHYSMEQEATPEGGVIDDRWVQYNKTRLRCNKRDECKMGLCECMNFLYEGFARLVAIDFEEAIGLFRSDTVPEEERKQPLEYIMEKRIVGSPEVCQPHKVAPAMTTAFPSIEGIFGKTEGWMSRSVNGGLNSNSYEQDNADFNQAISSGGLSGGMDFLKNLFGSDSHLLETTTQMSQFNNNNNNAGLFLGRSFNGGASSEKTTTQLPDIQPEDIPTFMENYETLLYDYERLARNDQAYIPIYEKLLNDYHDFLTLQGEFYTPEEIPATIREALKIFNSELPPQDHQREWWMSLVEQDNHEDVNKNDQCCGELPYWTPYNSENGSKACCGKSGSPHSWKTYSIDFFTCCDGETRSNGEGGCYADSYSANNINDDSTDDETEDNDYEEDDETHEIKIIPDTFIAEEDEEAAELASLEMDLRSSDQSSSSYSGSSPFNSADTLQDLASMDANEFENYFAGLDIDLSNLGDEFNYAMFGATNDNDIYDIFGARAFSGASPAANWFGEGLTGCFPIFHFFGPKASLPFTSFLTTTISLSTNSPH